MRVLFLKHSSDHRSVMWEVHDGPKWWTAAWCTARGRWTIVGGKSWRELSPDGRTGKRIVAAIEASK